jgi:hypothetical protein
MEKDKKDKNNDNVDAKSFIAGGIILLLAVYFHIEGTTPVDDFRSFVLFLGSTVIFLYFIMQIEVEMHGKRTGIRLFRWITITLSLLLILAYLYVISEYHTYNQALNILWLSNTIMVFAALLAYYEARQQTTGGNNGNN